MAYLTSQYPASSHTFIRREVEAVRERGIDLQTFSIRRPSTAELVAEPDKAAYHSTWYALPIGVAAFIRAHLSTLVTRPRAYMGAFAMACGHRPPGGRALLWALFHFAEAVLLARELQARRIEHLHNHFANAGATVGLLAARLTELPWSLTLHGISETDYPAGLTLADKIAHASFVACVSWFGRAQAMRITSPNHWSKMLIVRCGLDLRAIDRLPARKGDGRDVVCVGRLSPEKGHLGLLQAFAALVDQGCSENLILVGDGPDRALIEAHCSALGLTGRVRFLGRMDEAGTLTRIADAKLLVLPSFMEGLPIVLMEAMALGVPVVACRVAGVPELVEDGREGLLFRPSDWDDLADKLLLLLRDEEVRARMAAAGRDKVRGEFNVSTAVEPLVRFYSEREGTTTC